MGIGKKPEAEKPLEMSEAIYDSSGSFTVEAPRQRGLLGDRSLTEPGLAVLWLVQAAVAAGASEVRFRLRSHQLDLAIRPALTPPSALWQRLLASWGEPQSWQRGDLQLFRWPRRVPKLQLQRECEFLRQRARFCPIPVKLQGYIVQPHLYGYQPQGSRAGVPRNYHLAEVYQKRLGPGVSLFRSQGSTAWKSREEGTSDLRWWMPWRVAGQVARLRPARGIRAGAVALLLVQPGQPSSVVAVSQGVIVGQQELDWPELPGLQLVLDVSDLPLDLSNLQLVQGEAWKQRLQEQRQWLGQWVAENHHRWDLRHRRHSVMAEQNQKEITAWLSVWGASLISGAGIYLPLPLLALPWIVWHHSSRRSLAQLWQRRLRELSQPTASMTR